MLILTLYAVFSEKQRITRFRDRGKSVALRELYLTLRRIYVELTSPPEMHISIVYAHINCLRPTLQYQSTIMRCVTSDIRFIIIYKAWIARLAQWSVARIRTPAARVQSPVPLDILGMCLWTEHFNSTVQRNPGVMGTCANMDKHISEGGLQVTPMSRTAQQ